MPARVTRQNGASGPVDRAALSPSVPAGTPAASSAATKSISPQGGEIARIAWYARKANPTRRSDKSLTHDWIWNAIDTLAGRNGLTASGLARLAGLDPTAFNRSKRLTPEGRPRWPSTESIAKVLKATGTPLDAFATIELDRPFDVALDDIEMGEVAGVKIVGEIRGGIVLDWEPSPARVLAAGGSITTASSGPRIAVAVGDSSLEPAYSAGNILVASEEAICRPGDRVLVKPAGLPVSPRVLLAANATHVDVGGFSDATQSLHIRQRDLMWMARIILARQ